MAQHNTGVDSRKLQPGQVLRTPALPAGTRSGRAPGAAARTTAVSGETYVVQADDTTGFWGIAKKKYGDARFHVVLAEANPNVDPRRLQVGQTLRTPELTDRQRGRVVARAPRPREGGAREESENPKPYFEEYE